jgi:hypothetical protein
MVMEKEVKGPVDTEKKPAVTRREALERMAKLGLVIASPLLMVNCGGSDSGGYSSTVASAYMSTYHSAYTSHYASAVYTSSP